MNLYAQYMLTASTLVFQSVGMEVRPGNTRALGLGARASLAVGQSHDPLVTMRPKSTVIPLD